MRPSEPVGEFSRIRGSRRRARRSQPRPSRLRGLGASPLALRGRYLNAAAAALEARGEEIARDMSPEMGKPLREARGETARASQILRYAASEAFRPVGEHFEQSATGAQVSTRRRPLGVVALITPWNFPIAIPIWKLAPALIYGNTVVLKLAYEAPRTGLHIAEAFAEAELPAGVLNILTGRGSTVGAALVSDRRVRAISFTGSVSTGHGVRDEATQHGETRAARARRPQSDDRHVGRRPRPGRRGRVRRRILVGRAEMHGDTPHLRSSAGLRRVPRGAARADRTRSRRRPARPRRRGRPDRQRRPSSTRSSRRSSEASGTAAPC